MPNARHGQVESGGMIQTGQTHTPSGAALPPRAKYNIEPIIVRDWEAEKDNCGYKHFKVLAQRFYIDGDEVPYEVIQASMKADGLIAS